MRTTCHGTSLTFHASAEALKARLAAPPSPVRRHGDDDDDDEHSSANHTHSSTVASSSTSAAAASQTGGSSTKDNAALAVRMLGMGQGLGLVGVVAGLMFV